MHDIVAARETTTSWSKLEAVFAIISYKHYLNTTPARLFGLDS